MKQVTKYDQDCETSGTTCISLHVQTYGLEYHDRIVITAVHTGLHTDF